MNWDFYYNIEGVEAVKANLVYTPYISPDLKTFCMDFSRDPLYHTDLEENAKWSNEDLQERFDRELKFHNRASMVMPVVNIIDVDYFKRRIFLEWPGDDFYMMAQKAGGYDLVLPDWKEQWTALIKKMWSINILKFSLHPNSWIIRNNKLIPFNWFYSYDAHEYTTIRSMLKQISAGRQEKMLPLLNQYGLDLDTTYLVKSLQPIAFNSFRSNYPEDLINNIIKDYPWA